jgi:hypothetical protein
MPTALKKGQAAQQDVPAAPEPQYTTPEERVAGMQGSYGDDFEQFLYGPTSRPEEPVTAGATARSAPPPKDMALWIGKLIEASRQPGAPKELHDFIKMIRTMTAGA